MITHPAVNLFLGIAQQVPLYVFFVFFVLFVVK